MGEFLEDLSQKLVNGALGQAEIENLMVMHHFAKLLFTRNSKVRIYSYLCNVMGIDEITLSTKDDIETRDHVLQVIAYLMLNLESRLK